MVLAYGAVGSMFPSTGMRMLSAVITFFGTYIVFGTLEIHTHQAEHRHLHSRPLSLAQTRNRKALNDTRVEGLGMASVLHPCGHVVFMVFSSFWCVDIPRPVCMSTNLPDMQVVS